MGRKSFTVVGVAVIIALVAVIVTLVWRADRAPGADRSGALATVVAGGRTIADENARPGDADWQITRPALNGEIQAYTGAVSIQGGDSLDLYVSTRDTGTIFEADIYRMGWYNGAGARKVRSIKNISGENQGRWDPLRGLQDCTTCRIDPATLLVEAGWKRSLQVKTDRTWTSGYYLVKLRELKTDTSTYAIFIVRDDASTAPVIVQAPTNTWQGYNTWGDASLYGSFGADRKYVGKTRRAYRVSYERPYDPSMREEKNYGAGEFLEWEYNFVRWSEAMGYEMTYTTNVDVSLRGDLLKKHRLVISPGHDEYWTKQTRDAFEAARDAGTNLAFIGGNEAYWQSRLEPSTTGVRARTLTVYKDAAIDPLARSNPQEATVLFVDPPVSRPQSMLTGLAYGSNTTPDYQPWRPASLDNWIFEGAGIRPGASFPGIVGYEYDHAAAPELRPPNLEIVGSSDVTGFLGNDTALSSLYVAPSGATVFAAGTMAWSWGLDDYGHEDRGRFANDALRRIMRNIMDRLSAPRAPGTGPP